MSYFWAAASVQASCVGASLRAEQDGSGLNPAGAKEHMCASAGKSAVNTHRDTPSQCFVCLSDGDL